ncbi:hypothetical protein Lepto7375DRAFT_7108 [Leptolyngbya sp. PCC 7375]|nr:hypothetical protein Lepto7375DRAFT_7108 [Leptolyngbya sp. PCC 7375]
MGDLEDPYFPRCLLYPPSQLVIPIPANLSKVQRLPSSSVLYGVYRSRRVAPSIEPTLREEQALHPPTPYSLGEKGGLASKSFAPREKDLGCRRQSGFSQSGPIQGQVYLLGHYLLDVYTP